MGFGPVVDGKFLPNDPFILRNASAFKRVPTMSGIMKNDAAFFIKMSMSQISISFTQAQLFTCIKLVYLIT